MRFPFDILEIYVETLTTLTVHAPESYDPERRPDITLVELQLLNATCPNLKSLGVDMNTDGDWVSLLYVSHILRPLPLFGDHGIISKLTSNLAL
jgi:hypothetical protein